MLCKRIALMGLLAAASVGVAACGGKSSSQTTPAAKSTSGSATTTNAAATTTSVASGSSGPIVGRRGVVTMRMAIVGDPGNPSVGVVQTFGGPKGKFVDPPKNTGVYKNCSDAPAAPPPCITVGGVSYTYGSANSRRRSASTSHS
jgi:hypothetical protein